MEERYAPGDFLPSERELHRRFGVTVKTVRSALAHLSERSLVQKLPARGTMVLGPATAAISGTPSDTPSRGDAARPAAGACSGTVALVMPLSPYLLIALARGIEPALRRHGLRLMLCGTYPAGPGSDVPDDPQGHEAEVLESVSDSGVAGVLWWSMFGRANRGVARKLMAQGTPIVLLDNLVPHLACDWIGIDDYSASYQACAHLTALGHRDVAFIGERVGDTITVTYEERLSGYADGMMEFLANGTSDAGPPDESAMTVPTEWLREVPAALHNRVLFVPQQTLGEYGPLAGMLASERRPTALYISTDNVTSLVMQTIHKLGLRVPDDIAVVTTGDVGRFTGEQPSITAIRQPFDMMARRAVRLLMQRMREPDRPIQHVHLPTRLIVRQSTVGDAAQHGRADDDAEPHNRAGVPHLAASAGATLTERGAQ